MSTLLASTRGLNVRFGDVHVLRDVNISVEEGRILGYVGPNGAGKTTTMRVLTGTLDTFAGEVSVLGFDPRLEPLAVKAGIGYLPEGAALPGALTLAEFLLFIGRMHGLDDALIRRRGDAYLEAFELSARLGDRLGTLSKGMRQKVLLTASLIHAPRLLIVDEPLSGLDARSVQLVGDLLRRFADSGRGVVYCSHVLDIVERTCDEITILDEGRVLATGSFEALASNTGEPTLERVLCSLAPAPGPPRDARRLVDVLD